MRPYGRIITHMPFWIEIFGRISSERLVSVDAEINYLGALDFSPLRHSSELNGFHLLVGTLGIISYSPLIVRRKDTESQVENLQSGRN